MTCQGCERALERAVSRIAGVQQVAASHVKREASITFDGAATTTAHILAAIRNAGYTPTDAPS
jgi:copper chaperone CopZ